MYEQLASDYAEFHPDVLITGEGTEIRWLISPEDNDVIASHAIKSQMLILYWIGMIKVFKNTGGNQD